MGRKFSCYVMGDTSLLVKCCEQLREKGHTICGIVTSNAMNKSWAEKERIPTRTRDPKLGAHLKEMDYDYLFSIANLSILPEEVLHSPKKLAINFHDGPLPRYAGLNTPAWALMEGESSYGISWHVMTDRVDEGNILKQAPVEISEDDTAFSLNTKCYEAAIHSFGEVVDELENQTLVSRKQDLEKRTYFGFSKRPPSLCYIDWNRSAEEISRFVHALYFGPHAYENPLGHPKIRLADESFIVSKIEQLTASSNDTPGKIVEISNRAIHIATSTYDIKIEKVLDLNGRVIEIYELADQYPLVKGSCLSTLTNSEIAQLNDFTKTTHSSEFFWRKRLSTAEPVEAPYTDQKTLSQGETDEISTRVSDEIREKVKNEWGHGVLSDFLLAGFSVYLFRLTSRSQIELGFSHTDLKRALQNLGHFFASYVPLRIHLESHQNFKTVFRITQEELARIKKHMTYAADLPLREPRCFSSSGEYLNPKYPVLVEQEETSECPGILPGGSDLLLQIKESGKTLSWRFNAAVIKQETIEKIDQQFAVFLNNILNNPEEKISALSLLDEAEKEQVLITWNETQVDFPKDQLISQLFEAESKRHPDRVALVFEGEQLSYGKLNDKANQLARYLQNLKVGPDVLVGVHLDRSVDMIIALLGILKAGGAYLPLDPAYPVDRLAFMVEDADVSVILSHSQYEGRFSKVNDAKTINLDTDWTMISKEDKTNTETRTTPKHLAYVIYTSGSTGKPKGVMVEHQNVVNFFGGMDDRIGKREPGIWLAVTSISFDISVLELFWTLSRGYTVVLYSDKGKGQLSTKPSERYVHKKIDFSLFYFSADQGENPNEKYRLLLEGAKIGDQNGFSAVWTPERHFHPFGGLYPNPSIAATAVASITKNIHVRAGSVVLPLHSPLRVAEEWAVVDNISNGRVGISFAAGWNPNDFVILPENHADKKNIMIRNIEVVKKLWRGEAVPFKHPSGKVVEVKIYPRPIQAELPVWVTAAGNPETYRIAGESGSYLLTHLLGQSLEELAEKIALYRKAWKEAGHGPGEGHVVLMLHTYVGEKEGEVREIARNPMKNYLKSAVDLVKKAAWSFPTLNKMTQDSGKSIDEMFDSGEVTAEDMEALLDHSFERYYQTSGLFGTVEMALEMVGKVKAVDVDEIGCLIDFGVSTDRALRGLDYLTKVKHLANRNNGSRDEDYSIAALIQKHSVTHMQCTPSMAQMLMLDSDTRASLKVIQTMMIGGEAFSPSLAQGLKEIISGEIVNMYGPTETTIWSTTYKLNGENGSIPIGRPIANTTLYVLDEHLQPVPVGVSGELYIGGEGVVRGYLNRPDLTRERFIPNPFDPSTQSRLYKTGDLVRYQSGGLIEYIGRSDFQIKIRGYRIELGEIENTIVQENGILEAVVIVREDVPGDKRLVAYLLLDKGEDLSPNTLRENLKKNLTDFMVPSAFVTMDTYPLTNNGKIDRKALPVPEKVMEKSYHVAPETMMEETLSKVWQEILNLPKIGMDDNFFDLGGHSILMIQVLASLRKTIGRTLPLTDMFRFPTIRSLSTYLSDGADNEKSLEASKSRAAIRKARLLGRKRRQK